MKHQSPFVSLVVGSISQQCQSLLTCIPWGLTGGRTQKSRSGAVLLLPSPALPPSSRLAPVLLRGTNPGCSLSKCSVRSVSAVSGGHLCPWVGADVPLGALRWGSSSLPRRFCRPRSWGPCATAAPLRHTDSSGLQASSTGFTSCSLLSWRQCKIKVI